MQITIVFPLSLVSVNHVPYERFYRHMCKGPSCVLLILCAVFRTYVILLTGCGKAVRLRKTGRSRLTGLAQAGVLALIILPFISH